MVWIDYAILGIIGISSLVSLVRGFTREAISLVTWFVAFLVASQFYQDLSIHIVAIEDEMVRDGVSIALLFVCTLFLGAMINHLLGKLVDKTGLSGTDRVLGLVFGGLRGVLIVCALLFFMDAFTASSSTDWWQASVLIPEFKIVVRWFFDYLEQSSSLLQETMVSSG
ncbi:CvpA family protein [Echinimonas agarilytica]|uniref:CvpA family protein n=1 Tax=Echinimonas agarilytica TaxID=1215918 RepID=A0AA41W5Z3_9GAMM|nr:CvpA family protein [Echinimonas agarilytica]MCM2679247.1 CvpA family protein [Echinimonas agarilytica]